jgi:hypothetical protein
LELLDCYRRRESQYGISVGCVPDNFVCNDYSERKTTVELTATPSPEAVRAGKDWVEQQRKNDMISRAARDISETAHAHALALKGDDSCVYDNVIIMIQATANMIHGYVGGDREREERMIAFFKNMLDERFQYYWSNPPKKEN